MKSIACRPSFFFRGIHFLINHFLACLVKNMVLCESNILDQAKYFGGTLGIVYIIIFQ